MSDWIRGPLFLSVLALGLSYSSRARAVTYFVDGACSTSGNGSTLACGSSGPFKTIMEAIEGAAVHNGGLNPAQVPITIDIRGAHGSFSGDYDEHLGLWGVGRTATQDGKAHYYATNCTAQAPCVIQGCPASACGADEVPNITGLVHRTDWTQTSSGSGIWYRTMEARPTFSGPQWYAMTDDYDPGFLVRGPSDDFTRVPMQYSRTGVATPAAGRWGYDATTHRTYINPGNGLNPNTDPNASIWVPDQARILMATSYPSPPCPDSAAGGQASCPTINNLTLKNLNLTGGRRDVMTTDAGSDSINNLTLDNVHLGYASMFGWIGTYFSNLVATNVTSEWYGRGLSAVRNTFGVRLFNIHGASFVNVTVRHVGSAGTNDSDPAYGACPNGGTLGVWLDHPWDSLSGNAHCAAGSGFDLKQSTNILIDHYVTVDTSNFGLQIDDSSSTEVRNSDISRTTFGIKNIQFTDSVSAVKNNLIHDNWVHDCGYRFGGGCISLWTTNTTLGPGEFTARVYNNLIYEVAGAAITVSQAYGVGGNEAKEYYIWNNTIWGPRSLLGYPPNDLGQSDGTADPAGIEVDTGQYDRTYYVYTLRNFSVQNNIVANMPRGGLLIPGNPTTNGIVIDNGVQFNNGAPMVLNWKGTSYTAAGPSSPACLTLGFMCAGAIGDPMFVSTSPPDLHIQASSAARNGSSDLTAYFGTDIDAQPRPQGSWDVGADQYWPASPDTPPAAPSLLQVEPLPGS